MNTKRPARARGGARGARADGHRAYPPARRTRARPARRRTHRGTTARGFRSPGGGHRTLRDVAPARHQAFHGHEKKTSQLAENGGPQPPGRRRSPGAYHHAVRRPPAKSRFPKLRAPVFSGVALGRRRGRRFYLVSDMKPCTPQHRRLPFKNGDVADAAVVDWAVGVGGAASAIAVGLVVDQVEEMMTFCACCRGISGMLNAQARAADVQTGPARPCSRAAADRGGG